MLELREIVLTAQNNQKKKKILRDVSFSVKAGELIVVTGPNGSGKSSLAKIIMGVERPTSGKIIFGKKDITNLDCTERAHLGIAYSFQQPLHFKGLKVRDILQIAVTGNEALPNKKSAKIDKYLKYVGLNPKEYLDREINNSLSGGELKRIEIASVLARSAKISIFDEPEAGIDIWSFNNLVDVFKTIRKKYPKRAIIIISHQERIMKLASRIIILKSGKISAQGAPSKIMSQMETDQ